MNFRKNIFFIFYAILLDKFLKVWYNIKFGSDRPIACRKNEKDLEFNQGLSLGGKLYLMKKIKIYLERYEVASGLAPQERLSLATIVDRDTLYQYSLVCVVHHTFVGSKGNKSHHTFPTRTLSLGI